MILIREVPPPEPPVEVELESLLAPVPGAEPNSILFENRDGLLAARAAPIEIYRDPRGIVQGEATDQHSSNEDSTLSPGGW